MLTFLRNLIFGRNVLSAPLPTLMMTDGRNRYSWRVRAELAKALASEYPVHAELWRLN